MFSPSAGPIIEQGTHFCDLSRYFGGDVDISSVQAHSLEWHENAGRLSKMPVDENAISPENRIPRVTAATWYDSLIFSCRKSIDCVSQEVRKWSGGHLDSRCSPPGSRLQL